jgi:hypothetical protein
MQNSLRVIEAVHEEWAQRFGRRFAPLVEEYRLDGADYAIMTLGSMTGAAKDAIDEARDAGKKVGLIKIKTFSPFPVEALLKSLNKIQALGVVDRSVGFRWNCGPMYQETMGVLYRLGRHIPVDELHRRPGRRRHHGRAFPSRHRRHRKAAERPGADRAGLAQREGLTMEQTKYLVVGSSHAALEAVTAIRMHDAEGSLTLLTRDPHLPYSPTVLPYVVSGRSAPDASFCATRSSLPDRRSVEARHRAEGPARRAQCTPSWPTAARSPTRRSCSPPARRPPFRRFPASTRCPTMCCARWTMRRS